MSEDSSKQVELKLSPLAYCPLTTYESGHCLTQLFVTWDWFNSIPQWQRTKFWRPANHYSHWKNPLVQYYYLRGPAPDFVLCSKEPGTNWVWIHSIGGAGKLQSCCHSSLMKWNVKGSWFWIQDSKSALLVLKDPHGLFQGKEHICLRLARMCTVYWLWKTLTAVRIEWILSTIWFSCGRKFLPNVNEMTLGKNNTEHVNCNQLAIDYYSMFRF